jgi:hypothetical protein
MLECLVLGDSIATGIHKYRPECVSRSVVGYTSWQWNKVYSRHDHTAKTVIISLGSNDRHFTRTRDELEKLRSGVQADKIYWILPNINHNVQDVVEQVAKKYGDIVLKPQGMKPGQVHPTEKAYKELAHQTRQDH